MKIFLDTADVDEIGFAVSAGVIDGVTTNPSLIKQAVEKRGGSIDMEEYIEKILELTPGPVSLEVISVSSEKMVEEARLLYSRFRKHGQVVIKIPVCSSLDGVNNLYDGLRAIRILTSEGIPVNATLVMSPEQAILAAKAGATYVSPFAGRIDDYIRDRIGMKRGKDYQKSDYYDFNLMKKVESKAIDRVLSSKNTSSPREVYLDGEVRDAVSRLNDNGIHSGVDLVRSIVTIFRNYHFKSQVIASSIRNARQVREMAEIGVDIVTIPFYVLRDMLIHYKTIEGINDFIKDVVEPYRKIFTR
ncbi:MAG: transaldolase [Thaumarchaeota archaeon]|jgi:transaldolase|nr:transaldolase [Candidatus Geocrenenecus arthurdayi]MCL7388530.1 transaldolase [Candidatus Geocrenenecus arthurdayi]MCL7391695.1 transaldolase [Candidatus Geocrenenecus arthurdayi]